MPYKNILDKRACQRRYYLKKKNDPIFLLKRHRWLGKKCPTCFRKITDQASFCKLHRIYTKETRRKISIANTGKKQSKKTLLLLSKIRKGQTPWNKDKILPRGENANNWQGGKTSLNRLERGRLEIIKWRIKVFERDNYTCKLCGDRGSKLNAHHIRFFSDYPELRFDINNGITLCENCHKFIHRSWNLYWLLDGPYDVFTKLI